MRPFKWLYGKVLSWSSHQHAPYYLAGVSLIESSFFPIPPDVMLIPMILGRPLKAWHYATITTTASILGGLLGYILGFYAFEMLGEPIIQAFGYQSLYVKVVEWFHKYGFLAILTAGFTPIPYKMFTIAAGAVQMSLFPFIIASIFGRGLRFFLVAAFVRYVGKRLEPTILKYIDLMGWLSLGFVLSALIIYQFI